MTAGPQFVLLGFLLKQEETFGRSVARVRRPCASSASTGERMSSTDGFAKRMNGLRTRQLAVHYVLSALIGALVSAIVSFKTIWIMKQPAAVIAPFRVVIVNGELAAVATRLFIHAHKLVSPFL
jgi:hypothetical protein